MTIFDESFIAEADLPALRAVREHLPEAMREKFWRDGGCRTLRNKDVQNLLRFGVFPTPQPVNNWRLSKTDQVGKTRFSFQGQDLIVNEFQVWPLVSVAAICGRRFGGQARFFDSLRRFLWEEEKRQQAEERKKDTSEVDGSTQSGDETHGGDSSSGEVPDGQSQTGSDVGKQARQGVVGGEVANDEAQAAEVAEAARQAEAEAAVKQARRSLRKAAKVASSQRGHGLGSAPTAEFGKLDMVLVRQCRRALASLVNVGADEIGPRWDAQKLAERLLSKRPLYPARKAEESRPIILVVADVSGSCNAFSEDACAVAQAAAALGVSNAAVVTVRVTNVWCVHEVQVNGKQIPFEEHQVDTPGSFAAWIATKIGGQIQVVVGLGDSDEESSYRSFAALATVERVIWIDNYDCNRLGRPVARRAEVAWPHQLMTKLRYFIGAGNAQAMVVALGKAVEG